MEGWESDHNIQLLMFQYTKTLKHKEGPTMRHKEQIFLKRENEHYTKQNEAKKAKQI